ncbi:MAG: argininosuccinate synthase-related protein [Vibrio sp.]
MNKVRSLDDLEIVSNTVDHILTLFSGGLDSTYVLDALSHWNVKVTALAVDLGEDVEIEQLELITKHYGYDLIVIDAKNEFAELYISKAVKSQAMYLRDYPVSSSLSRPLIARKAVEIANELNCGAIIHTANQSQNSLRRLNGAINHLGFKGFYGSPYEFSAISRDEKILKLFHSGLVNFKSRTVSGDANLWCREFESGTLEDPENLKISNSIFTWSQFEPSNHFENDTISVEFEKGKPVKVNGQDMNLVEIIKHINIKVGSYEIGRYIGFDHLDDDEKVIEIREAPAAYILFQSYKLLATASLSTKVLKMKANLDETWTQEAVEGRWDSELQQACFQFISHVSQKITGVVSFKLSKGYALATSIIAKNPKYLKNKDLWEIDIANKRSCNSLKSTFVKLSKQEVI